MFATRAIVHSKNDFDDVKIVFQNGVNDVIAEYKGNYYTAIFNSFRECYYVDDIYGEVSEDILRSRGIIK